MREADAAAGPAPATATTPIPPQISTDAGRTTVEVVQSTRRMNFLTVHENELDTISAYNSQATAFYSLSSACATLCFTIIIGAAFADKFTDTGKAVCLIGIPLSAIFCLAFLGLALIVRCNKNSSIARIKRESQGNTNQ